MTVKFAAAIYTPKQSDKSALPNFAKQLKKAGVNVAGIIQESTVLPGDTKRTIESIDIQNGNRIPIKNPMKNEEQCGLDVSNLIDTSAILRNVLKNRPDLVLVEKFGVQEQEGRGLSDEIMQIIVEGIPLLIAVPEPALEIWQNMTGGMGVVIKYETCEMQHWFSSLPEA